MSLCLVLENISVWTRPCRSFEARDKTLAVARLAKTGSEWLVDNSWICSRVELEECRRGENELTHLSCFFRCMYKLGFDSYAKRSKQQAQPIMDIEELVTTMKEKKVGS